MIFTDFPRDEDPPDEHERACSEGDHEFNVHGICKWCLASKWDDFSNEEQLPKEPL